MIAGMYMERRKYYVPMTEIYRAYEEHKSKNPSGFLLKADFESVNYGEDEYFDGSKDTVFTRE